MNRPRGGLLPTVLLGCVTLGCVDPPPSDPSLVMEVGVSPTPALMGEAQLRVELSDTSGAPIRRARVVVTGLPPHDESGSVVDTATERRPGLWVVDDFRLSVPGEWTLEARATLPDGRVVGRDHPILVLRGQGGGAR